MSCISMQNTVYGHSFKPIDCIRHIYEENLEFRNRRRLAELSHQPFDWLYDNDPSPERLSCPEHSMTHSTSVKYGNSNWVESQDVGTQTVDLVSFAHREKHGLPCRKNKVMQTDLKFAIPSEGSWLDANVNIPHQNCAVSASKRCVCGARSKQNFNHCKCAGLKEERYFTPAHRLPKNTRVFMHPDTKNSFGEISESFLSKRSLCKRANS